MDQAAAEKAVATAMGDQSLAILRERLPDIEAVTMKRPETWTHDDKMLAWLAATMLCGFVREGRL